MYVIYTSYGAGMVFRTGPPALRVRHGLWAHFYVRQHPRACDCPRCWRRVSAGPIDALPEGRVCGRMYAL